MFSRFIVGVVYFTFRFFPSDQIWYHSNKSSENMIPIIDSVVLYSLYFDPHFVLYVPKTKHWIGEWTWILSYVWCFIQGQGKIKCVKSIWLNQWHINVTFNDDFELTLNHWKKVILTLHFTDIIIRFHNEWIRWMKKYLWIGYVNRLDESDKMTK